MDLPLFLRYPSAIFPDDFEYLSRPLEATKYQWQDAERRKVTFTAISQLLTEAAVLRAWTDDNGTYLPAGRIEFHMIRYVALLMDFKVRKGQNGFLADPWFQENVWCLFKSLEDQRACSCFFGNQNQGKTAFMSYMAVALGCLHPLATNQVLMAPVKEGGTAGIWQEFAAVAKATQGNAYDKVTALGAFIDVKESNIVHFCTMEQRPGGYAKLHAAANCASIQGRKEKAEGFLIHWLDEIGNDYPNGGAAWLNTLPNIASNNRFFGVLACNPRNQTGGLDSEMEPAGGWDDQTDLDFFWKAAGHNINVYRRSGEQSPNFNSLVGGRPIEEAVDATDTDRRRGLHGPFPWLYNGRRERKLRDTVNGNLNDPRFKEQGRGMMPAMSATLRVITQRDIDGSGYDLNFMWFPGPGEKVIKIQRVAFLDPAKTVGGDRNILSLAEFGYRMEQDELIPTVHFREQVDLVPTGNRVVDHEWLREVASIRRKEKEVGVLGTKVSFEKELAILAARQCEHWRVPFANYGFDDSLSGSITAAMIWAFGDACLPLSFGGKATSRPILPRKFMGEGKERRPITYCDLHAKHVSELYSRLAHWLRGGYIRVKQQPTEMDDRAWQPPTRWIKETLMRLCKRRGEIGWDVETKLEYKSRRGNISPDYADSFIGVLHMIEARGFMRVDVQIGEGDEDWNPRRRMTFQKDLTTKPQYAA